ncbi:MAG: hypothetical protein AMXMBFR83_26940 [Phycisphaerae bacterium]
MRAEQVGGIRMSLPEVQCGVGLVRPKPTVRLAGLPLDATWEGGEQLAKSARGVRIPRGTGSNSSVDPARCSASTSRSRVGCRSRSRAAHTDMYPIPASLNAGTGFDREHPLP